ncbi:MAG: hypothetical protein K2L19_01590, partial [Eubacterium sp.]|nr:hypothetical protein [Eubacterium sp.]
MHFLFQRIKFIACFLIDYENESGRALEGISLLGLTKNDELIFFYSKNAARITMELHRELERITAKKLYIKLETGTPNSLDFQLSSYLGACIQKNPEKEYFIVSKDCGYDCVCQFWKNKNIFVSRIERFS